MKQAALFILMGASAAAIAPDAQAAGGYAWAHDPWQSTYAPDPGYSSNSAGGAVTIRRDGVGSYSVNFDGLNVNGGNAQVVAYGDSSDWCNVAWWANDTVYVRCWAQGGVPADTKFFVSLVDAAVGSDGATAYVWNPSPVASGPVSGPFAFSNRGGSTSIFHDGLGWYTVVIAKSTAPLDQGWNITAYGTSPNYCTAWQVGSSQCANGTCDLWIGVHCFDADGAKVDAQFSLITGSAGIMHGSGFGRVRRQSGGFAARGSGIRNAPPLPSYLFESNWTQARELSPGQYAVDFSGLIGSHKSGALVSAASMRPTRCKPARWLPSATGAEVSVVCFDSAGNVDTGGAEFSVSYQTSQRHIR